MSVRDLLLYIRVLVRTSNWEFKRRLRKRQSQISDMIGWMRQNNHAARGARFLVQFFDVVCTIEDVKLSNLRFWRQLEPRAVNLYFSAFAMKTIRAKQPKVYFAYFIQRDQHQWNNSKTLYQRDATFNLHSHRNFSNYPKRGFRVFVLHATSKKCTKVPTARAARLFRFHSTKFRNTPPVLVSQLFFNLALLHVCVLSYPLAALVSSVPEVPAESCNKVNTTEN